MDANKSAGFQRLSWFLAIGSWGAVAILLIVLATVVSLADGYPENWTGLLLFALPALFYIYALGTLGALFARFARGAGFAASLSTGLRHTGTAIALGGLSSIAGVMLVSRLVTGRGSFINLDVPGIVLVFVGVGLFLIAQLFDRARDLQAELDEMI